MLRLRSEKELPDDIVNADMNEKEKNSVDVKAEVAAGIVEGIQDVAKENSKVAKKILERPPVRTAVSLFNLYVSDAVFWRAIGRSLMLAWCFFIAAPPCSLCLSGRFSYQQERLRAAIAAIIALIPILLKYVAPGMLGHAQTALVRRLRGEALVTW